MKATERFSNRAKHYARYRPGYPDEIIRVLESEAGWTPQSIIADMGAGTGISSELFLRHGNEVWAVEPNADMRSAAQHLASQFTHFHFIDATAENTGLQNASVDFVVAATAFHWFDAEKSRIEFRRILKPGGRLVLMWNQRKTSTPFLEAYEDLLARFGSDYNQRWGLDRKHLFDSFNAFFQPAANGFRRIDTTQHFDYEALQGRLLSSSYVPLEGDANFAPMTAELEAIFANFAEDGKVAMEYETSLLWGRP
jgi:ubiquinone/menaquinone biosynthesis C-methylase UbiE